MSFYMCNRSGFFRGEFCLIIPGNAWMQFWMKRRNEIFRLVYSKRKENCHIVLAFKPPLDFPTTFCASKLTRISPFSFSKTSGGRGQNLLFEFAYVLLLCWLGSPMNYFIWFEKRKEKDAVLPRVFGWFSGRSPVLGSLKRCRNRSVCLAAFSRSLPGVVPGFSRQVAWAILPFHFSSRKAWFFFFTFS